MKQVSFIHTADLHLDSSFSSLQDGNKAEIRRNELEQCFENIVEKVRSTNSNLLIISGDFFEDSNIKGSTVLKAKNLFSELYTTEIVICPGNHDPLKQNSYYNAKWGSNVHILEDTNQVLYFEKYNTCIYNMGSKGYVDRDFDILKNISVEQEHFNILIFHGTVDMPFEEGNYNSISSKKLSSLGMDYIALGHMHCYSRLYVDNTLLINPGSPEPLGFDEEGAHGIIQGNINHSEKGKSVEAIYIPTAKRHYHNIEVNITDCTNDNDVVKTVLSQGGEKFTTTDLYSITLKGFIRKDYQPGIRSIIEAFSNSCFYMKIKNQTSAQFEYEEYLEDPGIKGEFVRRIIDMLESETSEKKRQTLFMALQYGLQAMENGRVE